MTANNGCQFNKMYNMAQKHYVLASIIEFHLDKQNQLQLVSVPSSLVVARPTTSMKFSPFSRGTSLLFLFLTAPFLLAVSATDEDCKKEFEKCDQPEDCCGTLDCAAMTEEDKWNFKLTCLSERSIEMNNLPQKEQIEMLVKLYQGKNVPKERKKSRRQVEQMFAVQGSKNFARILNILEHAFPPIDEMMKLNKKEL